MKVDEQQLIEYVTEQRWYGSKSRTVSHSQLLDVATLREADPEYALTLVEIRFDTGQHEIYQLLVVCQNGELQLDGLQDPALARELVHSIRAGQSVQAREGVIEFGTVAGFAGLGREMLDARSVGAEQSNTSIVFDDDLILKVFRRLEPGINPELEMLRFLTEHGFANIAALAGWYAYSGGPTAATLGILQEFVQAGRDGWELGLDELASDPDAFLARLRRLGVVTGEMHTVLASEANDSAFCPETPSVEAMGLLTATVDEEISQVFLSLPEDDEAVAPIVGRGEEVREQLRMLTHSGSTGKSIRTHGDYHLGQTMFAEEDWVILDFEGEPARSLTERRRKRSPLRDVAGMLRSFAYLAIAAGRNGADVPEHWEEQARATFLEGYLETVDASLLPSGQAAIDRLLAVFELEKSVYELRYELDNRPDWVAIPVAGIQRLIEQVAEAS
jgi:trehalose synthase-fused probable maltokinase